MKRWWVALLIVLLVLLGRACLFRPSTAYPGSHFNRGLNAVWLGVEWVHEPYTLEQIAALTAELQERQIRYVFAYVSYLRPEGEFNSTFEYALEFVQAFHTAAPELKLLAWLGVPMGAGVVDLSNPAIRQKIVTFSSELTNELGFDGVHLDPEPIPDGDLNVLALLDETRQAMGPEPMLSLATRRIWPLWPNASWPVVGAWAWSGDYYREVAARVDQVAVMVYDSALPHPRLYQYWTRYQVIEISRALPAGGAELLFGIPTSEEQSFTHRPNAENMTSGLQGTLDGLNDLTAVPAVVTGVAIYPYWETDAAEWNLYEALWLGASP